MDFYSGGKRHSLNVEAIKSMTYEDAEKMFKGILDFKALAKELKLKPTPKKKVRNSED